MRAYVSLPEEGAPLVGEAVRAALHDAGHEALDATPAPVARLAKSERDAFLLSVDRLHEADLLVADATVPSARVGWEVAWFLARGRLVIVCCAASARSKLSFMLAGNPSPWQKLVLYEDAADLRAKLVSILRGS